MTLRKFVAPLVAVMLLGGLPPTLRAESVGFVCVVAGASADGQCCGAVDAWPCMAACQAQSSAPPGTIINRPSAEKAGSPPDHPALRLRQVARAPDTPPPKRFSV